MDDLRVLAAGIGFTEGPVWTSDRRLWVTTMSRGRLCEIAVDGSGVVGEVETGGGPNGLCEAGDGRLWVAQNGAAIVASRSERPAAPGLQTVTDGVVAEAVGGFRAPNDLVEGPDGRIWFTDPRPPGAGEPGTVHVHDPATGETSTVAGGIDYPNGLVFDAAGTTLLVAETATGRVLRYDRDGTTLHPQGVFATLPEGGPDGMALAADGSLWVAAPSADLVAVFEPDGTAREPWRFAEPTFPTNLCFVDEDLLVVTAVKGGRVLALPVGG